jgi:hypothetical protein
LQREPLGGEDGSIDDPTQLASLHSGTMLQTKSTGGNSLHLRVLLKDEVSFRLEVY